MFIERKLNKTTGLVELWYCEWKNEKGADAQKVWVEKICDEQALKQDAAVGQTKAAAICWSYGRTLGNIAVNSPDMLGRFPANSGADAELPCDFVDAGKYRHGEPRVWCRTHQTHWGTKADFASREQFGAMRCANYTQKMNYVVSPYCVNVDELAEIGIWCSMPAAISSDEIAPRPPKIHVHVRDAVDGKKKVDKDFNAISIRYGQGPSLFGASDITLVNVTPPAAFDFVCGLELLKEMDCINCCHCGYPHLDLGDFAQTPHRKHFCGNCGRDSTWSKRPIVSTPLKPLHDAFAKTLKYVTPNRSLNLDDYHGCSYTVWASTPAIVWTAAREQEFGIHVHVHNGADRVVDDTFGEVILDRKPLERATLVAMMMERTIV